MKFWKVDGNMNYTEKEIILGPRKFEEYKVRRFYNGDCTLVVDVWLYRVDEDVSGLTFEEWDPSVDTDASQAPVEMIVNSSELHATGFDLRELSCYEWYLTLSASTHHYRMFKKWVIVDRNGY